MVFYMGKSNSFYDDMQYKIMQIIKRSCEMSLCAIWEKEKGKEYYIASDTRAIDMNGNILDEKRKKVIRFNKFPIVLVSTGFSSFTTRMLTLEQYILEIENEIDTIMKIEEVIYCICDKMQKAMIECMENFPDISREFVSIENLFLYNNENEILPLYRVISLKGIYDDIYIKGHGQNSPERINDTIILGHDNPSWKYLEMARDIDFTEDNFIAINQSIFTKIKTHMESYGFATINDKLDVFRIDTKGIHWLERSLK